MLWNECEQTCILLIRLFVFYSVSLCRSFYHYLHIFCCLAKPITPLCWYLLVLGYLPVLHLIFTTYIYVQSDEWYFSLWLARLALICR